MALLVQAQGYYYGDELKLPPFGVDDEPPNEMSPEPPNERSPEPEPPNERSPEPEQRAAYAAMGLYMAEDDTGNGDSGTSDETGPPSDDFMREVMDQPKPGEDGGKMAYEQQVQNLRNEILNNPLPRNDLNIVPINRGQLDFMFSLS